MDTVNHTAVSRTDMRKFILGQGIESHVNGSRKWRNREAGLINGTLPKQPAPCFFKCRLLF